MVSTPLRGVAKVQAKGRIYYYAWRGGPRLAGKPGSPEFLASYVAAVESRRPSDDGRMRALVSLYKDSPAFRGLADSTRKEWTRRLDRIVDHFGNLRVAQFDRVEKIRPIIRVWRDQWADRPREADYAIQVLSRLLSFAVDTDRLSRNACEGLKSLYKSSRADIIWTDADLMALKAVAPMEVWWAVNLAAHTGLRAGDLKKLSWSHINDDAIIIPTDKSRGMREAFVPLYDELRAALAEIPRRSPVVLTNSLGRPWTAGVNGSSFEKARKAALPDRDLHFHDLRGTAATRFHLAGLSNREIAEIMGWEEQAVDGIIRRYVGRRAIALGIVQRMRGTQTGTDSAKPGAKP